MFSFTSHPIVELLYPFCPSSTSLPLWLWLLCSLYLFCFGLVWFAHLFDLLFLLYLICVHAKLLELCLTVWSSMNYSPPGSSIHGILQARILEWIAMTCSRLSPWLKHQTHISYDSCFGRQVFFTISTTWEALYFIHECKKKEKAGRVSQSQHYWLYMRYISIPDLHPLDAIAQGPHPNHTLCLCRSWQPKTSPDITRYPLRGNIASVPVQKHHFQRCFHISPLGLNFALSFPYTPIRV